MREQGSIWLWFVPALVALFSYGIGQGLVKKWIAAVPPARFCLYFVAAKSIVNLAYFSTQDHPVLLDEAGFPFLGLGVLAYVLDGLGWILYFQSIVMGPITIVGTLSAAYPALTVLFAGIFLHEALAPLQYAGVIAVISGCIGLSRPPADEAISVTSQPIRKLWIPLSLAALVLWAASQTLVKYSYGLPVSSEVNLALCNMVGGMLTLGIYGFLFGRAAQSKAQRVGPEWIRSFLPMGLMAGGDLGVLIANRFGPVSIVTPITGAYPLVTLGFATLFLRESIGRFQWFCVGLILLGMGLSTWIPGSQ
jgi:drug/metabolite transporter (DMT)-like permease